MTLNLLDKQPYSNTARKNVQRYKWLLAPKLIVVLFIFTLLVACIQLDTDSSGRSTLTPVLSKSIAKPTDSSGYQVETQQTDDVCHQDPKLALTDFLANLHNGFYEKAAQLYAGNGNPNQRAYLPNANEDEKIKINAISLEDFCNGYGTCLQHKIVSSQPISQDQTIFTVRFFNVDATPFTFTKPIVSEAGNVEYAKIGPDFKFTVERIGGCFKNLDIPPVTP